MSDWRKNDERCVNETLKESKDRLERLAENWSRYKVENRRPKVIIVDGRDCILV